MSIKTNVYKGSEFMTLYNDLKHIDKFGYVDPRSDFYDLDEVHFFTLSVEGYVIGIAHIRKSPYVDNTHWLSYLSVLGTHQNLGYASVLSEYIIKWFSKNNITFETSSYSYSGFIKLKPLYDPSKKTHKSLLVEYLSLCDEFDIGD